MRWRTIGGGKGGTNYHIYNLRASKLILSLSLFLSLQPLENPHLNPSHHNPPLIPCPSNSSLPPQYLKKKKNKHPYISRIIFSFISLSIQSESRKKHKSSTSLSQHFLSISQIKSHYFKIFHFVFLVNHTHVNLLSLKICEKKHLYISRTTSSSTSPSIQSHRREKHKSPTQSSQPPPPPLPTKSNLTTSKPFILSAFVNHTHVIPANPSPPTIPRKKKSFIHLKNHLQLHQPLTSI